MSIGEFRAAMPMLQQWGVSVNGGNAQSLFDQIDTSGNGSISFEEFAAYAIKHKLDMEGDSDQSSDDDIPDEGA